MGIRTSLFYVVLATACVVASTGLWLLVTSGALSPTEQAASAEFDKAWRTVDAVCLKYWRAKRAWKSGAGSSQAEVERLASELRTAEAWRERTMQVYGPIANRSQAEQLAGRNKALMCFLVAGVLALIGGVGLLGGARRYSAAP